MGWTRVSQTRQGILLISFPFSLYSTFKEGCCIFAWFLCACSSPGFFPNYGYTLLCNALSMPIRLKNHFTGFSLKHGGSTCFTHIHESLSRSPSSNPFSDLCVLPNPNPEKSLSSFSFSLLILYFCEMGYWLGSHEGGRVVIIPLSVPVFLLWLLTTQLPPLVFRHFIKTSKQPTYILP